jgi:protein-S-isoprenylcysteine O-methyltransferase Ste14
VVLYDSSICHDGLAVRATKLEFRYRFFVLALIFWLGFSLSWFGTRSATVAEYLAHFSGHPTRLTTQIVFGLGALVIGAGAAIRTWATAYLQGEIVHDMALHSDHLVADGPYRYVRNPLYLGTIFLAIGMSVLATWPGAVIIIAGVTLFNLRLIGREEQALLQTQGGSFKAFRDAVPRLFPAYKPCLPAAGLVARWPQAWLAESFIWAFAVALLCFALTLNTAVLFAIIVGNLLIYATAHIVNSRSRASSKNEISNESENC